MWTTHFSLAVLKIICHRILRILLWSVLVKISLCLTYMSFFGLTGSGCSYASPDLGSFMSLFILINFLPFFSLHFLGLQYVYIGLLEEVPQVSYVFFTLFQSFFLFLWLDNLKQSDFELYESFFCLIEFDNEALYWIFQCNNCVLQFNFCLVLFLMVSTTLLNFSCIVFLIWLSCLSVFSVAHWTSLKWLFGIPCQTVHRSPFH